MKKTLVCPSCDRAILEYDARATIPIEVSCKKCRKLIIHFTEDNRTILTDIPERKQSGGMRYW